MKSPHTVIQPYSNSKVFKYIDKRYEIKEDGTIWSKIYQNRECKPFIRQKNDPKKEIALVLQDNCKNDIIKKFFVDVLVATKFCKVGAPDKICVIHINGDNLDNRACNLKWATLEEEMFNHYLLVNKNKDERKWFLSIINGACSPLPGTYSLQTARKLKYVFPMVGYEGIYTIDTHGNVFSIRGNRYNNPTIKDGYVETRVSVGGKSKTLKIHRMVALTFIPNINPCTKNCIDHLDENKLNNTVSNLEWVSPTENTKRYLSKDKYEYKLNGVNYTSVNSLAKEILKLEISKGFNRSIEYIKNLIPQRRKKILFGKYKIERKFIRYRNPNYEYLNNKNIKYKVNGNKIGIIDDTIHYIMTAENRKIYNKRKIRYRIADAIIKNKTDKNYKLYGKYKIEIYAI